MADRKLPCPTVLRLLLRYDPATGELYWRKRARVWFASRRQFGAWNTRYAGTHALSSDKGCGYKFGAVLGVSVTAHRVAWAIHFGAWPKAEIDHINGDPADNRVLNLRDVSAFENQRNQGIPKHNSSGIIGVSWCTTKKKWSASIRVSGRLQMLGYYEEKSAAAMARKAAEVENGFHPNHGARSAKTGILGAICQG